MKTNADEYVADDQSIDDEVDSTANSSRRDDCERECDVDGHPPTHPVLPGYSISADIHVPSDTASNCVQRFLDLLDGVTHLGHLEWTARCPAHEDQKASLTIGQGDDGRALVHCHAGCDTKDVMAAVGLAMSDLFEKAGANGKLSKPAGRIVKTYDYTDGAGKLLYQVVRHEPKDFRQRRPDGNGGWEWKMDGTPRVLYRLPELVAADTTDPVFVVEGEKDVDNLVGIGLLATTNPGGAGKWVKLSDDSVLHGRKVFIVADNDDPGRKHAKQVAEALHGKAADVRILNLSGPGKDLTDWIEAQVGKSPDQKRTALLNMATSAPVYNPPPPVPTAGAGQPKGQRTIKALTDLGNAKRLVRYYGKDIKYCELWGKWLFWDGKRWRRDDSLQIMRFVAKIPGHISREARREKGSERRKLLAWAKSSQDSSRQHAMEKLARSLVAVTPNMLDQDDWLLNVDNGTIDLRTGQLRPHNRDYLITKIAPVDYDPNATCPLWDKFMTRVMDGNADLIGYLQRVAGICLTGDVSEQFLVILYGQGANGKNVFLDTLTGMLGDYAGQAPPKLLATRKHEEHATEIADLCGKRFIASPETWEAGQEMRVQLVKSLTGDKRIKARFMRRDYFEFERKFKIIVACNSKPIIREDSNAVWRRLHLVPFTVIIPPEKQDKKLTDKLKAEWPGILRWAVRGCLAWKNGGLVAPDEVKAATNDYREEQSKFADFLASRCVFAAGQSVKRSAIYREYVNWVEANGEKHPESKHALYDRLLKEAGVTKGHVGKERIFRGVGIRTSDPGGGPNAPLDASTSATDDLRNDPCGVKNTGTAENAPYRRVLPIIESTNPAYETHIEKPAEICGTAVRGGNTALAPSAQLIANDEQPPGSKSADAGRDGSCPGPDGQPADDPWAGGVL